MAPTALGVDSRRRWGSDELEAGMRTHKKLPVPQERLSNEIPAQSRGPARRNVNVPAVVAAVAAELEVEMAGAAAADVATELVSRLETELPGVTFNRDALRDQAESIHRKGRQDPRWLTFLRRRTPDPKG